jgi:hypothetical protein
LTAIGLSSEVVDRSFVLDADFPCNEDMKADVGAAFEVKRKSERYDGNFIFSFGSTFFSLVDAFVQSDVHSCS